jgi:hypothetical protein
MSVARSSLFIRSHAAFIFEATNHEFPLFGFTAGASRVKRFLASPVSEPKKKTSRSPRPAASPKSRPAAPGGQALSVIDNRPLQRDAWTNFHTVRKRLEKTARDLHRHEEIDVPAYQAWLSRTFPVWITTLRELHSEVSTKSRQVQTVIALAELTGRSVKKLWREQKQYEANPEEFADDEDAEKDADARDDGDDFFDEDHASARTRFRETHAADSHESQTPPSRTAKAIYRRLVQHLHPDRGGEWNQTRKRLWHEVQQAWAAGDADWLARLEVEWETANEILGPGSPISRLRQAITELIAARRDIERKLRAYRRSPHWRFTLSEKKRHILHARTYANFRHDVEVLQRQLEYLNRTIAVWEKDEPRGREHMLRPDTPSRRKKSR